MSSSEADVGCALLSSCQRCFPSWTNLEVRELATVSAGWECEVYAFALAGEEAGAARRADLILRVYQGSGALAKSAREFATLRQLHRSGYPVPRVFALEQEESSLGQPLVIMERIVGSRLGEIWPSSAPEQQRAFFSAFLKLYVDLHALDWRPFVADPACCSPEEAVGAKLDQLLASVRQLGRSEFEPILAWLKARLGDLPPGRLAVNHGDFHALNVLLRDDGAPFVVDWTQADVTDYRFDLGWTLLVVGAFEGSQSRDVVLAGYEGLSGAPVAGVEYFEVAAGVKFLLPIVVSLAGGTEAVGLRSEATAAMRQCLPQIAAISSFLLERTGLTISSVDALLAGQPRTQAVV